MSVITIAPGTVDDHPALLALNTSAIPAVNHVDATSFTRLTDEAFALLVAREEPSGPPAGFLLAFAENAAYESPNYRYFERHHARFVYVDRVVVDSAFRRRGVGAELYRSLFERSADRGVITCEVNLKPPNPGSMAFHTRLGFSKVGEQDTEGGRKRVALLTRPAAASGDSNAETRG